MIANLFPWGGDFETSARQFNAIMLQRYERALDFIKLHYCLTRAARQPVLARQRRTLRRSPDSLARVARPLAVPARRIEMDIDPNVDIFTEPSWQYVLYGMGWKTDLQRQGRRLPVP